MFYLWSEQWLLMHCPRVAFIFSVFMGITILRTDFLHYNDGLFLLGLAYEESLIRYNFDQVAEELEVHLYYNLEFVVYY